MKILSICHIVLATTTLATWSLHAEPAQQNLCDLGQQAFENTVYDLVQSSSVCVYCHNGSHDEAPGWASASIPVSYARTKGLVNFAEIKKSKIVERAANGHCGRGCTNVAFQEQLASSITDWWEQGEDECESYRLTDPQVVALSSSPSADQLRYDLTSVDAQLHGLVLELDFAMVRDAGADRNIGYVVSAPRIVNTRDQQICLRIKNLRIFINGRIAPYDNAFQDIDRSALIDRVNPEQLSDDHSVIAYEENGDEIAVGFKEVAILDLAQCARGCTDGDQQLACAGL